MVTELTPKRCNRLFAFSIPLKRSAESKAQTKLLYSANVSRFSGGPRDRLELYIRRGCIHTSPPEQFLVMAYREPPSGISSGSVVMLQLYKPKKYGDANVIRYRDWGDKIGDVYFPKTLIGADPPEVCYLVIMRASVNDCGQ